MGLFKKKQDKATLKELIVFDCSAALHGPVYETHGPEDFVTRLNEFLTAMTRVVTRNGGVVEKAGSEGVHGWWEAEGDAFSRSCIAAVKCLEELQTLNKPWADRGLHDWRLLIGVHSGTVIKGSVGPVGVERPAMLGDAVERTAYIKRLNSKYGTSVLISEDIYKNADLGEASTRIMDRVPVKGTSAPMTVYELAEKDEERDRGFAAFTAGLDAFFKTDWDEAKRGFNETTRILGVDQTSRLFLDRIEYFKENPPGDGWDGVSVGR